MKQVLKQLLLISILLTFGCKAANLRKDKATDTVEKLHDGMLLVKLKTSENRIKKYKEMGNMEKAKEVIEKQQTQNEIVINAFKDNFNFCPVYFFHSNDIANIKNNDFKGSLFQNIGEDLETTPSSDTYYLIGELDQAYQDELGAMTDGELKRAAGSGGSVNAIVIRDNNNFQIPKPFPYRATMTDTNKENIRQSVANLNQKLIEFERKMKVRKLKRRR